MEALMEVAMGRVVTSLLKTKAEPLMEYLQDHVEVFPALAHHIDTTSIAEVLVRLTGADITTSSTICAPHFSWLSEEPLQATPPLFPSLECPSVVSAAHGRL